MLLLYMNNLWSCFVVFAILVQVVIIHVELQVMHAWDCICSIHFAK